MTLDIRGSLKNTRKSKNQLVVFDELFANSIDAFLIRRASTEEALDLEVKLKITATKADLLDSEYELEIECVDNGCGLGPRQLKAFVTKDTSYKDDLKIPGIGNCKGSGRVQFFHHFSKIEISSMYEHADGIFHIGLPPRGNRKVIEEDDFKTEKRSAGAIGTSIKLSGLLKSLREESLSASVIERLMTAKSLKQHLLVTTLQRFVSLKDVIGDFRVDISCNLSGKQTTAKIQLSDIPEHTASVPLTITHSNGKESVSAELMVTHYRLPEKQYGLPSNIVGLCAKSAIAENITGRYLKTKALENNPIDGFFHIILIEGQVLDAGVNEQRDGFDKIPLENEMEDLFDRNRISFEDIYSVLDDVVQKMITPPDWSRNKIVDDVANDFGISEAILSHSNTRVTFGDTANSVAKRALKNLQEKVVDETVSLISMKESLAGLEPTSDDFRQKINDLSWEFTSSLKTVDMANLSQLVVRRSNMIDVLALTVKELLDVQKELPEGQRRNNEALIHNIFFPMRKDSEESADHDVWLLSEEYHYYDYIASDKPLSKIKIGNESVFDQDIDDEIDALLQRISDENRKGRPDIALFHEEGSVVIVEFKAPGVSLDEHDNDLIEYATILAAKSKGKLKKFYGYLIGDTINPVRLRNYQKLPGENGWFDTTDIKEPNTQYAIGQLYSELLHYDDIVDRARKRIGVYRERLKLPLD